MRSYHSIFEPCSPFGGDSASALTSFQQLPTGIFPLHFPIPPVTCPPYLHINSHWLKWQGLAHLFSDCSSLAAAPAATTCSSSELPERERECRERECRGKGLSLKSEIPEPHPLTVCILKWDNHYPKTNTSMPNSKYLNSTPT